MAVKESELRAGSALPHRIALPRLAVAAPAAIMLAFVAEAALFVSYTYLNRDEGWYMLGGQLAYRGSVPYRDFPYFQTPLALYVFGLPGTLFSPSIIGGRIVAAMFGAVSIALVLHVGRRMGGVAVGALAAVTLLLTPDFMVASTTARAEAIVIPLTLLAVAIMIERPSGVIGFAAPPALLLIATGARLAFLPAFALTLAFCYWRCQPSRRDLIVAAAILATIAALIVMPFLLSPPHRAFFDVWASQSARNDQFLPEATPLYETLSHRAAFLSLPAASFFVVLVPVLFLGVYAWHEYRRGWRLSRATFDRDPLARYAMITGLALALWLPFAGFDHQEARYFVPSFALLSVVTADVFVRASRGRMGETMRLLPPVMAVLFVAHAVFQTASLPNVLDTTDVTQTEDAGAYIRSITSPDDQIITINPTLALEARRPLPSSLLMGQFSFWPKYSDERARNAGVVNVDLLEQLMLDPRTDVIALDDYDLELIAGFRDEDPFAPENTPWPEKLFPRVASQFDLVRRIEKFGQFSGTLYILKRSG